MRALANYLEVPFVLFHTYKPKRLLLPKIKLNRIHDHQKKRARESGDGLHIPYKVLIHFSWW